MNDFTGLYSIRDALPEDKNFILATFLRGLYYGDSWFSLIPKPIFMENYKKVAEYLVSNPKVTIKVACLKEEPNVILGYSIVSEDSLSIHWVFVKSIWRYRGIAKALLPTSPTTTTHLSALGKTLLPKFKNCIFNPFAI